MARMVKNYPIRDEFLILTNGKRTETNYFESLKSYKSVFKVQVKFLNDDPKSLVKHAISEKNDSNHVWCVFDKDQFPSASIYEALDLAKQSDIHVAFSNIAFEVWLVNHFCQCYAEKSVSELMKELNSHLKIIGHNEYSKNDVRMISKVFLPRLNTAMQNADIVHQKRVLNYRNDGHLDERYPICEWNSYTNIHLLIKAMKLEKMQD